MIFFMALTGSCPPRTYPSPSLPRDLLPFLPLKEFLLLPNSHWPSAWRMVASQLRSLWASFLYCLVALGLPTTKGVLKPGDPTPSLTLSMIASSSLQPEKEQVLRVSQVSPVLISLAYSYSYKFIVGVDSFSN
jgi:hypothetical protein